MAKRSKDGARKCLGAVLGACGRKLRNGQGVGLVSQVTCEECKRALGVASRFLGAARTVTVARKRWCMRCRTRHLLTTPHDTVRATEGK